MDTKQLEYIIAISRETNLSLAAKKLYISQSALSQQLAKAEKMVNAKLFDRNHNEMILTDAGKIYLSGASTILQIKKQAMAELEDLADQHIRHLSIGLLPQIAPIYYANVLPLMRQHYPQTEILVQSMETAEAKERLLDNSVSMPIFTTSSIGHSLLEYLPFFEDELLMILPPGANVTSFPPEHFIDVYPFAFPPETRHLRTMYNRLLARTNKYPEVYSIVDDLTSTFTLVENGHCAAFAPRSSISKNTRVQVLSLTNPYFYYIVAAYKNDSILRPAVKYLIKQLLIYCNSQVT